MATIPVAMTVGRATISPTSETSDESNPIIAVDPTDTQKLYSVWTRHDTTFQAPVQELFGGAFSVNGGRTWTNFNAQQTLYIDPASGDNPQPFAHSVALSVSADRNGNVYVLGLEYSDDFNSGVVTLSRYVLDSSGGAPNLRPTTTQAPIVRNWNRSDDTAPQVAFRDGDLVVDSTLPSFTDPANGATVVNPNSGNVYLSLLADTPNALNANPFNPFTVQLIGSKDQGVTFSGASTLGSGNFTTARNSMPRITVSQGTADGRIEPGRLTAVFLDTGSGNNFAPLPQDIVVSRSISVDSSGITPALILRVSRTVATTNILATDDTVDGQGQTANPANTALGFTAAPVIASDNTLGQFSPTQGRLYVAFVDRYDILRDAPLGLDNPATNTDIFLSFSDDGGNSWSPPRQVNDDNALVDGHSQAVNATLLTTGRPQFMPEVAVDPTTGTLVMTWRDARDDAAGVRVATYITTSINGGGSFSDQTFLNAAQAPFDESIRRNVTLGPVPDNQSAGNPNTEPTFGYGTRMGLTALSGQVISAWAGNVNGGPRGLTHLDVIVARAQIAGGPRIVSGTQGPAQARSVARLSDNTRLDFNNQTDSNGKPIVDGLVVTFDRPVDPSTFNVADAVVYFRDPNTPGTSPGEPILPTSVTAIDSGNGNNQGTTNFERAVGATQFLVRFPGSSRVGTYTYSVGPNISDRIRNAIATRVVYAPRTAANLPTIPDNGTPATSTLNVTAGPGEVINDVNVKVSIRHQNDNDLTIRLIPPPGSGVQPILLSLRRPAVGGIDYLDTTFDEGSPTSIRFGAAPFTGSFSTDQFFQDQNNGQSFANQGLNELNGRSPAGNWTLEIVDGRPTGIGQLLGWGLVLSTRSTTNGAISLGNAMDQDADGTPAESPAGAPVVGFLPGDVYSAPNTDPRRPDRPDVTRVYGDDSNPATAQYLDFAPPYTGNSLPISVPGAHLVSDGVTYNAKPGQVNRPIPDAQTLPNQTIVPGVLTSTITIGGDPNLQVTDLNVSVTIDYARSSDLRVFLVTPDGTNIPLALNPRGATDFDGTTFDDQATAAIPTTPGTRRLIGRFLPNSPLYTAAGQSLAGAWTLRIEDSVQDPATPPTTAGVLQAWSLTAKTTTVFRDRTADRLTIRFDRDMDPASLTTGNQVLRLIGPNGLINGPFQVVATPRLDPNYPDPDVNHARTYQVILPSPGLSGSYVARLSAGVRSEDGLQLDSNQDAGLDNLRGTPSQGTTPITYFSTDATPIGGPTAGASFESPIVVPDDFLIQDIAVQLNITFPNDPALKAFLVAPDGQTVVQLFANLPVPGANFRDTIFDDRAPTPISNAGPPYSGRFAPQPGVTGLTLGSLVTAGVAAQGTWRLRIIVDLANVTGTINSWRLTLAQPVSTTGLGDSVTDRPDLEFRTFTLDPTDPLSSSTWTAVGPAGIGAKGKNLNAEVSGRINTVEFDPSDLSGNTAFAATPGGGVWKTTNFLTNDPSGPTWLPLLDNAPILGMNISDLAVFPRNNDPNQTVVFALTGDSDSLGDPTRQAGRTSRGVGFLRSNDGGRTWELLDSLNNNLPFANRDHYFASTRNQPGVTGFRLIVDPNPVQSDPSRIILFAAISDVDANGMAVATGDKGGLYRSTDSGQTWQRLRAGQATDVVFDPSSQSPDLVLGTPPTQIVRPGNLQFLYAAFRGEGVFFSPNAGEVLNPVLGTTGNPLIQNADGPQPLPVAVANPSTPPTPNTSTGRIVLAKPAPTGNALQDLIYRGYLYAAVVQNLDVQQAPVSDYVGLYLTKDFGQNWTKLDVTAFNSPSAEPFLPTNAPSTGADYNVTGSGTPLRNPFHLGGFDLSLSVDPLNPNIVYLGGTSEYQFSGLIRVDATGVHDAHSFFLDNLGDDGGLRTSYATASGVTVTQPDRGLPFIQPPYDPRSLPFLNLIRDPSDPFRAGATILVTNTSGFVNDGAGVSWTPYDQALAPDPFADPRIDPWGVPTRGVHRVTTLRDPLTGLSRLVFSTDQGIYSVVADRDGSLLGSLGSVGSNATPAPRGDAGDRPIVTGSRNGDIQIAQFYDGAAQPSQLSAQLAVLRGFFYGSSESVGTSWSDPNIIQRTDTQTGLVNAGYGNLSWIGDPHRGPSRGDIATQQDLELDVFGNPLAGGTLYNYRSSEALLADDGRPSTDTFQVNGIARTFGLYQTSGTGDTPDNQFPLRGGYQFAVNPLNGDQIAIGSQAGRIFATLNRGLVWSEIGNPSALDGSPATAITYGAPPAGSSDVLQLDDYLIVGTENGGVYVTFTGGGSGGGTGNAFLARNDGLDGTAVRAIVTDPTRGSFRAYAVTEAGVYLMRNTQAGGTWENITGNLFSIPFNPLGGSDADSTNRLQLLGSLAVDFRYVIPDDFNAPNGPSHPVLYAGGEGGVYRSFDSGQTWAAFPDTGAGSLLNSPLPIGGLPNSRVIDLDLSLGNIDPQTGRPNSLGAEDSSPLQDSRGPNTLTATTYGRGQFTIRLAPIVFPNSTANPAVLGLSTTLRPDSINPAATIVSDTGLFNNDGVTNQTRPFVTGFSEQTAFGNFVRISLFDLTDPANPILIGGYDPAKPATDVPANRTTSAGTFAVQVNANVYSTNGSSDGRKTIGVQATNLSGTSGNLATFQFILDTVRPDPSGPLDLLSLYDTGLKNNDEITNPDALGAPNTGTLGFSVGFTADPTGVNTQATLLRAGQAVGSAVLGLNSVTLVDPGPLPQSDLPYSVRLTDLAGNTSDPSPVIRVRVDRTRPATPSQPTLDANQDTGAPGDNVTALRQPFFRGTGESNTLDNPNQTGVRQFNKVQLIDATNRVIGTGDVTGGTYRVQPSSPLPNGVYVFRVVVVDIAGNVSDPSAQIVVEIRNLNIATPTLRLVADDDSGFVGDNITNVVRPRLQGSGEPGRTLQIIDVGGNVPAGALPPQVTINQSGNYLVQFLKDLPRGTYRVKARAIDLNSGSFADSSTLEITIIPQGTSGGPAPTLRLNPLDDTGTKGDGATSLRSIRLIGQVPGVTAGKAPTVTLFQAGLTPTPARELDRTVTDNNGNFTLRPPTNLLNGTIPLVARTVDAAGNYGPASPVFTLRIVTTIGDYNADGRADLASYNRGSGQFSVGLTFPGSGGIINNLGASGSSQIPIQGDFDGDGKTDYGVVDFNTSTWRIQQSQLGLLVRQFGQGLVDLPVQGDFDGDGRADFAVYNTANATWRILFSAGGALVRQFGEAGVDQPNPADYDGDGKVDLGVFRATDALWRVALSGGGVLVRQFGRGSNFGLLDRPTPADFDGDGKADLAVFRPESTAKFIILPSGGGPGRLVNLGIGSDTPVPQDYDNDGKADPAILRPSAAFWQYIRSTDNGLASRVFGPTNDVALGAPLVPYRIVTPTTGGGPGGPSGSNGNGRSFGNPGIPASSNSGSGFGSGGGPAVSTSGLAGGLGSSRSFTSNDPTSADPNASISARQAAISRLLAWRRESRIEAASQVVAIPTTALGQSLPSAHLALGLAAGRRRLGLLV